MVRYPSPFVYTCSYARERKTTTHALRTKGELVGRGPWGNEEKEYLINEAILGEILRENEHCNNTDIIMRLELRYCIEAQKKGIFHATAYSISPRLLHVLMANM